MRKIGLIIPMLVIILLGSACADQITTGVEITAPSPAIEVSPTIPPTKSPLPEPTSTQTSPPPAIEAADQYPWISSSSDLFNQVVSIDPIDAQRIAYCAPGEIRVSQDAGQTWETVSTAAVAAAAQARGYALFYGEPGTADACLSVTLDPQNSEVYYAVFTAAHEEFGAPPVFYMGFFTPDAGESWQLVEPPENGTIEDFGGYWNLGTGAVEALFFPAGSWRQLPEEILITETANSGKEWGDGALSCPSIGPCLRWGPAPSNVPGMGSPLPQSIFHSQDAGETWSVIDPPVELRAPAPNQLVAVSETEILIISGGVTLSSSGDATPAIRKSLDAGASWQPIPLPPLSTDELNDNYFPGLQYLSNHTYLSQGVEDNTWYWLSPEMPIWCPVNTDRLPSSPMLLQSVGDQVWWVDQEIQQAEYISLSELTCAVE